MFGAYPHAHCKTCLSSFASSSASFLMAMQVDCFSYSRSVTSVVKGLWRLWVKKGYQKTLLDPIGKRKNRPKPVVPGWVFFLTHGQEFVQQTSLLVEITSSRVQEALNCGCKGPLNYEYLSKAAAQINPKQRIFFLARFKPI